MTLTFWPLTSPGRHLFFTNIFFFSEKIQARQEQEKIKAMTSTSIRHMQDFCDKFDHAQIVGMVSCQIHIFKHLSLSLSSSIKTHSLGHVGSTFKGKHDTNLSFNYIKQKLRSVCLFFCIFCLKWSNYVYTHFFWVFTWRYWRIDFYHVYL